MGTDRNLQQSVRPVILDLHPWATIPEIRFVAAKRIAKLVAMGLLERGECVGWLMQACIRDGYRGSLSGLQTTFHWVLTDHVAVWERRQRQAERAICKRIAPMMEAHVPSAALVEAARDENRAYGCPLIRSEVKAIVAEQVARFVRNAQWQKRQATGGRCYG